VYEFFVDTVPTHLPFLLQGAVVTIELSILGMICGTALGLLLALGRLSGFRSLEWVIRGYVEICRAVPLIVILLLIYFALPRIGIRLPAFLAAIIGLSASLGAYLSEVFRAAILAINTGERDAGISLGMSRYAVYLHIILPQALLIAVPTLGGYFIALLKDCSLVSFIAVNELLRNATIIISMTFRSMELYLMVAMIYIVLSFAASALVRWVERKLTPQYMWLARQV
jgi:His/Glu/Gln/Arg/opine family amino acid ABC transporter permease subunit